MRTHLRRRGSSCGRRRAFPRASHGARPRSAPGAGGCGRRRTPRGCRPSSRDGSRAAPASRRGSASRDPPVRRTRRRRPRDGSAPCPARDRGTAQPDHGRRAAIASRRGCRCRPRRPGSPVPTPARERLDPAGRPHRYPTRSPRLRRRGLRAGSRSSGRRSAVRPRGSRAPWSGDPDGVAPARWRVPGRRRARAARTRREPLRPRGGLARAPRPRRSRRARRSTGRDRSRARAGRGTRGRRSSARGRLRA